MELLEQIWEATGAAVNGMLSGVARTVTNVFGSSNARHVARLMVKVQAINALEPQMMKLTDAELREQTAKFKKRLAAGETLDDILIEAFAVCREGGRRFLKMRHYDVQMIGGMVLHGGNIAEMVTGEGKTLVATLPAYLNALAGKGVHVVTVNDYLARRDMEWMGPLYMGLGLTVANIQSGMDNNEKQAGYAADITYGTNNEFGFDYLRDNMRIAARGDDRFEKHFQQVQGPLFYAVIDEVDNILIDEARTPLIISGPAHQDVRKYAEADKIARTLKREQHFTVNEKDHTVNLTDEGVRQAEKLAGVESFYTAGNMEWPHMIDNALKAHYLYKLDVNYVVKDGAIVIVDEFTGRLMDGRQWSDGLHQAVEAKEKVTIKEETQTLATITLQNFFKLYEKISGMTGTAMTEASEFYKIYGLDVVAIPTNRSMQRIENPDVIFLTEKEKFEAVANDAERTVKWDAVVRKNDVDLFGEITAENNESVSIRVWDTRETVEVPRNEIERVERKGRPCLIGTVSIEKSERLSRLLEQRGIPHQVLNAKNHGREAEIIAQAGRIGTVTIATNMAGRGTDIILGGNAETMAWAMLQDKYPTRLDVPREEWDALVSEIEQRENMKAMGEQVRKLGGLYVIGTERHESRRIDLQLRGRCGRQGDPGSSRFYLSLEDDLMRIFAGDWVRGMMGRLGMGNGEPIESSFVSRRISAAQKKVEERNFEVRKNLLEYDEVMDQQRKRVYSYRQRILAGASCREMVIEQIHEQIERNVLQFTDPLFGPESYARFAGPRLSCQLDAKDFRGIEAQQAENYAKTVAERAAETQILDAIEENLPREEEESEWSWGALTDWFNSRYGGDLRPNDLKKISRDTIDEELINRARDYLNQLDLSEGNHLLSENYGLEMLVDWMKNKFLINVDIEQIRTLEPKQISEKLLEMAEDAYRERESKFPVIVGFTRFARQIGEKSFALDRDALLGWAMSRFDDPIVDQLRDTSADQLFDALVNVSQQANSKAQSVAAAAKAEVAKLFNGASETATVAQVTGGNGQLDNFQSWLTEQLKWQGDTNKLAKYNKSDLEIEVSQAVDDRYFPEIRRMERSVLLNIVDSAWKDHLLAMDHLRSAIGLKGYAQMDPKVEYKREGMRLFGQMWFAIGERTTDIILRMEGFDDSAVAGSWDEVSASHEPAVSAVELARVADRERHVQQAVLSHSEEASERPEPIRNFGNRVGRNDPCPCGSGKKYKNCCLRKQI